MLKLCKYDLHIHTVLSPCGSELNTPNNIVNMASLQELNLIAITDHNAVEQCKAIEILSEYFDFNVIYGIEVSVEDFHVVVYFLNELYATKFREELQKYFISREQKNRFLSQQVLNVNDELVETVIQDLMSIDITYNEFIKIARICKGLVVLAHIDRKNKSALEKYSLDEIEFDGLEFSRYADEDFINQFKDNYKYIINSDAHEILDVGENQQEILLKDNTIEALFDYFEVKYD